MKANSDRLKTLWLCLLLAGVTFVAFERVRVNEFVNYDDDKYVTKNPHVNEGLSRESIVWAFTESHASNWHPLTWISHMIDCRLFGTNAAGHHITNLLLHVANTILLFLLLKWMTGSLWPSVFAAVAFAIHPLGVESVAWIAERKDVLSTFFWMLTLWAYIRYARRAGIIRYLLVMAGLCLGLMAKPMVVTLPFVLLLLDYWPLGRFSWQKDESGPLSDQLHRPVFPAASTARLIGEKIPLIALAALSSVITFIVQQRGGAMVQIEHIPLNLRIPNALVSYVSYLGKMVWPVNLAPLYPFSTAGIPMWQPIAAFAVLLAMTTLVLCLVRKRGYLAVGWFWYLGTLVPVIGLVQVGVQSMADRYTYLPSIGISIMIAWAFAELVARRRTLRPAVSTVAVLLCLLMLIGTRKQVRYWRDNITLFEHACQTAPTNYIMQNNLGITLKEHQRFAEAIEHFKIALQLKKDSYEVHFNLANVLKDTADYDGAMYHYRKALKIEEKANVHHSMAMALFEQKEFDEAVSHYRAAVKIDPDFVRARYDLAVALTQLKKYEEAIEQFRLLLLTHPDDADLYCNLGVVLSYNGQKNEASAAYRKALEIDPKHDRALKATR